MPHHLKSQRSKSLSAMGRHNKRCCPMHVKDFRPSLFHIWCLHVLSRGRAEQKLIQLVFWPLSLTQTLPWENNGVYIQPVLAPITIWRAEREREMVRPGALADVCSGLLTQLCNGSLQIQTFGRNLRRQNKNIPPACHLVKPASLSSWEMKSISNKADGW